MCNSINKKFIFFYFLYLWRWGIIPRPPRFQGLAGDRYPRDFLMAKRTTKVLPISLSDSEWVEASQWLASHGEPSGWCVRTKNGDSTNGRWHIITLSPDKGMTCRDFFLRRQEDIDETQLLDAIIKKQCFLKSSRVPGMAGTAKILTARQGMVFLSRKQLESIK